MSWVRPRIIPVLLLRGNGLYKTTRFKNPVYVGDPINTVRIFNEKEVDEIVLLDIGASIDRREPNFDRIGEIASEAFMPMAYGGGVKTIEQAQRLLALGVEKIVLNSIAVEKPSFISELATAIGSQSVVISIDPKKNLLGRYQISWNSGQHTKAIHPVKWAENVSLLGAGEVLINCVDRDGTMQGYDIDLVRDIAQSVSVPVIACGGAGSTSDLAAALKAGASAAAAGALFVFQGRHRAVLVSYPDSDMIDRLNAAS